MLVMIRLKMYFPCIKCNLEVSNDDPALTCDTCSRWCHLSCTSISMHRYNALIDGDLELIRYCDSCKEKSMAPTSSAQLSNFTEVNFGTNFNENDCSAIIPATVEANASFSLVEGASNKGGVLLMDPNNYCYTKNIDKRRKYTDWTCRNARKYKCKAGYRALENGSYILLPVSPELPIHIHVKQVILQKKHH